jgi:hypothetical protein
MSKSEVLNLSPELSRRIVTYIAQDLISQGRIDPTGKTDEELFNEIMAWGKIGSQLVADHKPDLLKQARVFAKADEAELACLLYATWFEHWLNGIVFTLGEKHRIGADEIAQIIRDTKFDAKSTWLLRLLGARPIHKNHLKMMRRTSDLRNGFVHYKWKAGAVEMKKEMKQILSEVEKTVRYLMSYENKYLYKGQKKRVHKVLKGDT